MKIDKNKVRAEASKIRCRLIMDQNQCSICGFDYTVILNQHHIIPVAKNGDNKEENLIFVCPNCHS